jgi:hypothetical protein
LVAGGKQVTRANRVGVEKACLAGKNVMLANMATAVGGKRMRGVGGRGANIGVRFDVKGFENVVGIIKYTGPVHLANNATRPHEITPKSKRGKRALSPAGNPWFAASAQHPGTRGKKFAEKSEPIVLEQSKRIIYREVNAHLARTFSGR